MDTLNDLILSNETAELFLDMYNSKTHHPITLSSIENYFDKLLTFSHVYNDLTRLANIEVDDITEDTYITNMNKMRVWKYVVDRSDEEGYTLGIPSTKTHLDEWIAQNRISTSYIMAFAQSEHNKISLDIKQKKYESEHPSDPELRRRLFAEKFEKLFNP